MLGTTLGRPGDAPGDGDGGVEQLLAELFTLARGRLREFCLGPNTSEKERCDVTFVSLNDSVFGQISLDCTRGIQKGC